MEKRRNDCREIFDLFDRDNSGYIDPSELANGLRAMGCNPTEEEIEEIIQDGDSKKNDDGKLSFEEFSSLMEKYRKPVEVEESSLIEAFKCFDKNGDGKISRRELREALLTMGATKLTEEEVDDLFMEADADDNGYIDYKELVQTILK